MGRWDTIKKERLAWQWGYHPHIHSITGAQRGDLSTRLNPRNWGLMVKGLLTTSYMLDPQLDMLIKKWASWYIMSMTYSGQKGWNIPPQDRVKALLSPRKDNLLGCISFDSCRIDLCHIPCVASHANSQRYTIRVDKWAQFEYMDVYQIYFPYIIWVSILKLVTNASRFNI